MDDQKKYLRIAGDDKWTILGLVARHFYLLSLSLVNFNEQPTVNSVTKALFLSLQINSVLLRQDSKLRELTN